MSTKSISIAGIAFTLSAPYAAGHVITEAEARTLNQTRAENIGNNFRKDVKEAQEKGPEALAALQAEIAKYDAEYNFTMTTARTPIDPIEAEAIRIAKEYVLGKIKEAGFASLKAYLASAPDKEAKYEANVEKVAASDETLKLAKQRVAAKAKAKGMQSELEV